MRVLFPYLAIYKNHKWLLLFCIVLTSMTLQANIGLLTLSGWCLSASAVVGCAGAYSFNYMLPAAGFRGAAIIRTAGRYFERLINHDVTFRILRDLRIFIFSKLLPLSPAGLAHFHQGELLNCIVADVDKLDHLYLRVISPLIGALGVIFLVTFGLSLLDITLGLILGCIMLLTLLVLIPILYRVGKPTGESLTQLRGNYRHQLTAWLYGQTELLIFGAASRYREQIEQTELNWYEVQRHQFELSARFQALIVLIGGIAIIMMLWLSATSGVGDNAHPKALIALFVFSALSAFETLAPLIIAFQYFGQVIASALRITQITEQQPAVHFPQIASVILTQVSLTLRNVTFAYSRQTQPALDAISLQVAAGEHIAILGCTGCGKSTLLQLLTRAWNPQQGVLLLNDRPLSSFDELTLRHAMSVVPQRVHLFSATLRDNLLLALPDASDEALIDILMRTGLEKLLEDAGLNSWLGESGRQLSSGELCRLAIARALLHNAPLMLLDEPTEGLDASTERQLLDLLTEVMHGKTLLMVTHRLCGLARFNQIIVMDNGQIIEHGSHAELLEKQGRYYQLRQHL